jgi:hypothetical protein
MSPKMNQNMKLFLTLLLLIISDIVALSQQQKYYPAEEFQSSLIRKKKSVIVIYNGSKHSFTMEIAGDSIKPDPKPYLLTVNNKILNINLTQFQRKFGFDSLNEDFLKQNLVGIMNDLKIRHHDSKDLDKKYEFLNLNGNTFLFWTSEMPVSNKTIDKQYYLETICYDQVVVLKVPVMKGEEISLQSTYDNIKTFLTTIGKSLTFNNYPLDVEKLSKELKGK